jgi:phage terminase large subunit-like protein
MAGPHERAACRRHIRDLAEAEKRGFYFDAAEARRRIEFYPDLLTVEVDGQTEKFFLFPVWQFVVGSLFGWKWKASGHRRFREAYIEAGKGSGKTPMAAGIGLSMMLFDDEKSAEVYAAGAKKDQAMILFGDVVKMVAASPMIDRVLQKSGRNPVWQLTHKPSGSIFRPLSQDRKKSGLRVSCGLIDELHEHKDGYTINMLEAGFKGRRQPLLITITNSGFDRTSVCWERHENAIAIAEGLRENDRFFGFVMALDDEDDPLEDEACWAKTNPGLGVTVTEEYLRSRVNDARQIPGREGEVLRLNFCKWTDAEIGWITRATWSKVEAPIVDHWESGKAIVPSLLGAECYVGIDLSFAFDLTAISLAFPDGDKLLVFTEFFTPRETARERERRDNVPYLRWIDAGLIHGTPGKVVRKEYLAARLAELSGLYDIRRAAYDRYRHKELAEEMAELGVDIPWIEHPQGFRRGGELPFPEYMGPDGKPAANPLWMPQSVDDFEGRIIEGRIEIDPSPVTRWQVSSVVIRPDPAGTGGRVFDKRKSIGRIDGIVAKAMAIGVADARFPAEQDLSGFLNRPVIAA